MNVTQYEHIPVLLNEVLQGLNIRADGCYIDCTFGRGGHSRPILELLNEEGRLFAIDKDPLAIHSVSKDLSSDSRFRLFHGSFTMLKKIVECSELQHKVNGILFDLGVSSPQLNDPERGFSFRNDGRLDMRMNNSSGMTAAEWLMNADEAMITKILIQFGEERYARKIANAIVTTRTKCGINTTRQLADLIAATVPSREKDKHPATRTFQAIRIFINRELEEIEQVLNQTIDVLAEGGRLVVISFHSLEDRIVKRFMRNQARGDNYPAEIPIPELLIRPKLRIIGKAVYPDLTEIDRNPRARSAVLRIAERLAL
jgi:16S rRNA (cytosine1402-N4)-methyltransferase